MIRSTSLIIVVALFSFLFASMVISGTATYVGVKKCKMCHMKQFKVWEGTKHAKALDSLKTDAEKKDPKCLGCHNTMVEHACESCHGAGSDYGKSGATMKEYTKLGGLDSKAQCVTCHDPAKTKDVAQMKTQPKLLKTGSPEYTEAFKKIAHPTK